MPKPIIQVDFNSIDQDEVMHFNDYVMGEIAELPELLEDGDEVILFQDDGDIWVRATVHRQPDGHFAARSEWRFEQFAIRDE